MKLSDIHSDFTITETLLGDILASKITSLQTGLIRNTDLINKHKSLQKLISDATNIGQSLITPSVFASSWWEQLLTTFGIPKEEHSKAMAELLTKIRPQIDNSREVSNRNLDNNTRQMMSRNQRVRRESISDTIQSFLGSITPSKETVSNFIDLTNKYKRKRIGAGMVTKKNNEKIAILAINLLAQKYGTSALDNTGNQPNQPNQPNQQQGQNQQDTEISEDDAKKIASKLWNTVTYNASQGRKTDPTMVRSTIEKLFNAGYKVTRVGEPSLQKPLGDSIKLEKIPVPTPPTGKARSKLNLKGVRSKIQAPPVQST